MRRTVSIGWAFVASVSALQAASAADIPVRAPAVVAPAAVVTNWTGFYLTGGAGYGFWVADTSTSRPSGGPPIPTLQLNQRQGGQGWLARAGGGFDYQFNSRIVAGVLADYDFSSIQGSIQDSVVAQTADIKQTSSWAAGARIGWLATPDVLTYFNAGFSSARFSSGSMISSRTGGVVPAGAPTGYGTPAFTKNGWFLGSGVEAALGSGWFWRTEYRAAYYDNEAIQDLNVSSTNPTPRFNDINFKPTVQTVTTQVVYKFNSGTRPADGDLPARVPANWTGLHIEGGIGYGLLAADETTSAVPASLGEAVVTTTQRQGGKGWLGRVGGGYDFQFGPSFVAGVFADFDFSALKATISDTAAPLAGDIKQQWAWAAGGRAGVLMTPDILGYVAGGYTSAHFSSATMTDPNGGFFPPGVTGRTPEFTQSGWFVGGGTEYALTSFANGLFWRTEYRYASYGNQVLSDTVTGFFIPQFNNINFKPVIQTITSQLVYKFNWSR